MTLNLGVIGLGLIAYTRMLPAALACGRVRVAAVADVDPAMVERAVALTGGAAGYTDYRALLARDDVDVVYVATPNFLHAEQAIAAARAGKHVLCEKPLACSVAEGEAMLAAARESGVFLAVDYMTRFHPVLLEAARLVRAGDLGQPYLVRSHFSYHKPGGQAEFRLAAERQGGGPLADVGVYSLDMLRSVLGQEVVEAHGVLGRMRPGWGVHDAALLVLRLTDGLPAYVDATFDFGESGFELVAEKGVLVGRDCFSQQPYGTLELVDNLRAPRERRLLLRVGQDDLPPFEMYRRHLEHLADCLERGAEPETGAEAALRDLRVIERVYEQAAVPVAGAS